MRPLGLRDSVASFRSCALALPSERFGDRGRGSIAAPVVDRVRQRLKQQAGRARINDRLDEARGIPRLKCCGHAISRGTRDMAVGALSYVPALSAVLGKHSRSTCPRWELAGGLRGLVRAANLFAWAA